MSVWVLREFDHDGSQILGIFSDLPKAEAKMAAMIEPIQQRIESEPEFTSNTGYRSRVVRLREYTDHLMITEYQVDAEAK